MAYKSVWAATVAVVAAVFLAVVAALVAGSEPARAAFPGKNGKIAYLTGGAIGTMNPDGSGKTVLPLPGDDKGGVQWSSDGEKLGYVACVPISYHDCLSASPDVYVTDAQASGPVEVSTEGNFGYSFSWFPGRGDKIAYPSYQADSDQFDIYALEFDPSSGATASQTNLTETPGVSEEEPAVSPDGTRMAFTDYRNGDNEIYVMGLSGEGAGEPPLRLTNNAVNDGSPEWSPDGTKIAFVREFRRADGGRNEEIFVTDADGTDKVRLTRNAAVDRSPAFSPNGRKIAFASSRDKDEYYHTDVWKMGADGSNPTRLTDDPYGARGPDWQPVL